MSAGQLRGSREYDERFTTPAGATSTPSLITVATETPFRNGQEYTSHNRNILVKGINAKNSRQSPPSVVGTETKTVSGNPDAAYVNTSLAEQQNLTMRMSMRRFTRLTNAFSKKFESHCHALALYFFQYNWLRIHKTLRVTPAMAAGISKELLSWETIIELVDQVEQKAVVAKRWALLNPRNNACEKKKKAGPHYGHESKMGFLLVTAYCRYRRREC